MGCHVLRQGCAGATYFSHGKMSTKAFCCSLVWVLSLTKAGALVPELPSEKAHELPANETLSELGFDAAADSNTMRSSTTGTISSTKPSQR